MKKGQLTVEYLIILVTMILLFSSISMDLIQYSLAESTEMQTGEMINAAEYTVMGAVNQVKIQGPGAKKTVLVRASPDCSYDVSSTQIVASCISGTPSYSEYDGMTVVQFSPAIDVAMNCASCAGNTIESGNLEEVEVVKQ